MPESEGVCLCTFFKQHWYLVVISFVQAIFIAKILRKVFYDVHYIEIFFFRFVFVLFFLLAFILPPIAWLVLCIKIYHDWYNAKTILEPTYDYQNAVNQIKRNRKEKREARHLKKYGQKEKTPSKSFLYKMLLRFYS